MKKILFISSLNSGGGHEELWLKTAELALQKGYEVGVCVFDTQVGRQKMKAMFAYPNFHIFYKKRNGLLKEMFNRFANTKFKFVEINRKALKWQPDISLFTNSSVLPLGRDISLFAAKGLDYCMVGHSENALYWTDDATTKALNINFKSSKMNYFVSQSMLNLAQLQIGNKIDNAKIIRNPYNVPYETSLEFPSTETLKLACVGTYNFESKAQDILFEVMNLPKWRERNLIINLYGKGIHEQRLRNLIELFGLQDKIFLKGYCQTLDIWRENHALIMPSRHEGLPMAVIEAMLCGRFPIVTDVGGNGEIVIDGQTGFIAPAPRARYIDDAMEKAYQRKDEWQEIGQRAKSDIHNKIPSNPVEIFLKDLTDNIKK
jgi:glycosyltransferase involved in cell wall biosynthesis